MSSLLIFIAGVVVGVAIALVLVVMFTANALGDFWNV